MNMGKAIRSAREACGITKLDLARSVGVNPHTIYLWESGRSRPLRKYHQALADALSLSLDENLLGEVRVNSQADTESLTHALRHALALQRGVEPDRVCIDVRIAAASGGGS